jgi:hypothetical protein
MSWAVRAGLANSWGPRSPALLQALTVATRLFKISTVYAWLGARVRLSGGDMAYLAC